MKELNTSTKKVLKILQWILNILAFFMPIALFYLSESLVHDIPKYMTKNAILLNIVLFELILLLLFGLFGSLRIALILENVFFLIFSLANYYVISFRSTPIQPWDFLSLKVAGSVAKDFSYALPKEVILKLICIILLIALSTQVRLKVSIKKKNFWIIRVTISLLAILGLVRFTNNIHNDSFIAKVGLYDKLFTPTTIYYKDGGAVSFLMEMKYLSIDTPSGYSASNAKELLDSYVSEESSTSSEDYPNIIVIMNEAFSDLSVLGDFTTNEDYMPYIHYLESSDENVVTGSLNVSVVGGNTANTEFEFLTGNTMAFLPSGSVAYQQYINKTIDSLPYYLKSLGYNTVAAHPYKATGWERDQVYQYMCFDEMHFIDDFINPLKIRNYISDLSCDDKIIETYEKNSAASDQPLFMFLVTMQNHSSYTQEYDNWTPDITVAGSSSFALSNYLSLIKKSDEAFQTLTNYFASCDKKTIIVMFGDHQPTNSVVSNIYKLNGGSVSNLTEEETAKRYQVPFVIWANYDIETQHDVETSANFLSSRVLDLANVPLSSYQNYLKKLQESIPVLSAQTILDQNYERTTLDAQSDILNDYKILQYYQLFDAKNEQR